MKLVCTKIICKYLRYLSFLLLSRRGSRSVGLVGNQLIDKWWSINVCFSNCQILFLLNKLGSVVSSRPVVVLQQCFSCRNMYTCSGIGTLLQLL